MLNTVRRTSFVRDGARVLALSAILLGQAGIGFGRTPVVSSPAAVKSGQAAPADNSGLSEVQRLKAELLQAKVAIAQLRATLADREARLASIELTQEQEKLVQEFRQTLKADAKAQFDWTTLSFKPLPQLPINPKR
jgi:hypothetical protein